MIERTIHIITSVLLRVSIEVDPKRVLHTSPEMFAEVEKTFIIRYPKANAPTEIMAIRGKN